jgi:hypothetical protein
MRYPKMAGYTLIYEGGRGPSYWPPWGSNKVKVKGGKWSIIPADTWIEIYDRFGQPGTVLQNSKTGRAYDAEGVELPAELAGGIRAGETYHDVDFKGVQPTVPKGPSWKGLRYYPTPEARKSAEAAAKKASQLEGKRLREFLSAVKKGHKTYVDFMNKVFPPYKAKEGEYESLLDYLQAKGIF